LLRLENLLPGPLEVAEERSVDLLVGDSHASLLSSRRPVYRFNVRMVCINSSATTTSRDAA
jgi:hypothetical protein